MIFLPLTLICLTRFLDQNTQQLEFKVSARRCKSKISKSDHNKTEKESEKMKKKFEKMLKTEKEYEKIEEELKEEQKKEKSENPENPKTVEEQLEEIVEKYEDGDLKNPDEDEIKGKIAGSISIIIKEEFKGESQRQENIEIQLRTEGKTEAKKIEKEFFDAIDSDMNLVLPTKSRRSSFARKRAEGTARTISDELRNKIIIGKRKVGKQTSGKLNIKSAVRSMVKYNTTGEFDEHIFEKEFIETPEHSVFLMIDSSGSMAQTIYDSISDTNKSRLDYAKEVLYILAKTFENLDVKTAIRGFEGRSDILLKRWDDELDVRKVNGLWSGGNTPTAKATSIAIKKMDEINDELKIIFTITDGEPDRPSETKEQVEEARKKGIHIFGIFYGQKSDWFERSFEGIYGKGNFAMTNNHDELRDEIIRLYEKILKRTSYGTNGW